MFKKKKAKKKGANLNRIQVPASYNTNEMQHQHASSYVYDDPFANPNLQLQNDNPFMDDMQMQQEAYDDHEVDYLQDFIDNQSIDDGDYNDIPLSDNSDEYNDNDPSLGFHLVEAATKIYTYINGKNALQLAPFQSNEVSSIGW